MAVPVPDTLPYSGAIRASNEFDSVATSDVLIRAKSHACELTTRPRRQGKESHPTTEEFPAPTMTKGDK